MYPLICATLLLAPLELICVHFVWNTVGEVAATLAMFVVIAGNVVVLLSLVARRRWLTSILLAALVLLTVPLPAYLHVRLALVEHEARRIIEYAERERAATGGFPDTLDAYRFRWEWTRAYMRYQPGFRINWWADGPGVSHWYTPEGGFGYYPD